MTRAVFLDRDGVINRKAPEGDYIKDWSEFEFMPGAAEAMVILNRRGFKVIVVSNQRGIALGKMTDGNVQNIHSRMLEDLRRKGAYIDAVYYCPHEKNSCDCRKPETGMFLMAKRDFPDISLADSFMVGDSLSDMEAGNSVSCKCILIDGNCLEGVPYPRAGSLYDAVTRLIA